MFIEDRTQGIRITRRDSYSFPAHLHHNIELLVCIEDGICTVCGYEYHAHDWKCEKSDSMFHRIVCSGCGKKKSSSHNFDSNGYCTECGYEPHDHIWQFNGEIYMDSHGLSCTKCDSWNSEDHIYGDDGKCTVCGSDPPHEHQWLWNGESTGNYTHVLSCTCGEKKNEDHLWKWDGVERGSYGHSAVCAGGDAGGDDINAQFLLLLFQLFFVNGDFFDVEMTGTFCFEHKQNDQSARDVI